ncbi:MAG: HTH domain-containing protein [Kiritimatiellae bacterium]|jgi:predicted HTH transcriptional regulator|nr:HTH domain-containing protein [Kiritimatiellia bacterium]
MDVENAQLDKILELGEGQFIEFKESLDKNLSKEIVAFANASGGSVFLGISDSKAGTGIKRVTDACKNNGNSFKYNFSDAFSFTIYSNNVSDKETTELENDLEAEQTRHVPKDVADNVVEKRLNEILELLKKDRNISAFKIAKKLNVSARTIQRDIEKLTKAAKIKRVGPDKGGYWKVLSLKGNE